MSTSKLKELTSEHHKKAEGSKFVQRMIKKELTPYQYYVYLCNQLLMYDSLESYGTDAGVFDTIDNIKRSIKIHADISELELKHKFDIPICLQTTFKYLDYIKEIETEHDRLLAHVYVRHMGDLSGGQIIKRFVPGSGTFYEFNEDTEILKSKLREKLHDNLAPEAIICFNMITEFMEELENSFGSMATSD